MIIHCINTGSSGNCYLIEYEPKKMFMLDCGVPSNMVLSYLKRNNLSPKDIKFCLISHLHVDHLHDSTFINSFSIPIYFPKLDKRNQIQQEIYKNLINYCGMFENKSFKPFEDQALNIYPFKVPHDAFNFGYKILLPNGKILVYMTDFGNIQEFTNYNDKVDLWMIECNYDIITIEKNDDIISRRSKSDTGHCSNEDCYTFLKSQLKLKNSNILLLHKSSERFNDEIGYKIFEDLDCKTLEPIKKGKKYIYN